MQSFVVVVKFKDFDLFVNSFYSSDLCFSKHISGAIFFSKKDAIECKRDLLKFYGLLSSVCEVKYFSVEV